MTAGLDAAGMPLAWKIRTTGPSICRRISARHALRRRSELSQGILEDMPYDIPNYFVDYAMRKTHVPVGVWRSVNHCQNASSRSASSTRWRMRRDRTLFVRRKLLAKRPSSSPCSTRPRRPQAGARPRARHVSRHRASRLASSICAQVVETRSPRQVRVHRVVSAIDAGHVVNPLTVEMQTESAIVYGLTAALYGEISIKDGRVEQSNFHDYPMLRMAEMPRVETVIVPSGGLGRRRGNAGPSARACLVQRRFRGHGQAYPLPAAQEPRFEKRLDRERTQSAPIRIGRIRHERHPHRDHCRLGSRIARPAWPAGPADAPPGAIVLLRLPSAARTADARCRV